MNLDDLHSLATASGDLSYALQTDPYVESWSNCLQTHYCRFKPRPDDPANFDQQASFCYNRDPLAILVGGNASGTTEAAAYKTALFTLRQQPPPRKDTPFWILANTYDQVGDVIWKEKLLGHGHIPGCEVEWDRISWRNLKKGQPDIVPLRPWEGAPDRNWCLHFKSYEQGREALQAASIGGFFFSEQFPLDILTETLRGCREYMFPGGQFAEFTPIDPELCLWVEKAMDEPPPGWVFYRCNTAKNRQNLAAGWFESFFSSVPEELLQTRLTGALATFAGAIYQAFNVAVHVVDDFEPPAGCRHGLGTDWGASEDHPQVTIFGAEDGAGTWWIYDEYVSRAQDKIVEDHAKAVVELAAKWGWPVKEQMFPSGQTFRAIAPDAFHGVNHADPSRPGSITEFTLRGVPTLPARNQVYEGINHVRALLKCHVKTGLPRLFIARRCTTLIEQLRKYRWRQGRKALGGSLVTPAAAIPEPLKRDDDTCDALRYLLFSRHHRDGGGSVRDYERKTSRTSIPVAPTGAGYGIQLRGRGRR